MVEEGALILVGVEVLVLGVAYASRAVCSSSGGPE